MNQRSKIDRKSKKVLINKQGQAIGRKGEITRQRLMDAMAEMLERKPLREIRVAEIAETTSAAPSTFYLYFDDVEDAVLALIMETYQSNAEILEPLEKAWPPEKSFKLAQNFVRAYIDYWDENYAVLRVRNLMADSGEDRFNHARMESLKPIVTACADKIKTAIKNDHLIDAIDPDAGASVVIASLERLATAYRRHRKERPDQSSGTYRKNLITAAAYMTVSMLTGQAPNQATTSNSD
ncbi:MAG: TetR/AcrR family transcriptional regulator [Kordiimonadaceae bacterium]|nr:TetR/AcrR family transcriptional regulator [Kordiimonadaceae bacterium]